MDLINQGILAALKQNGRIGWGQLAAQLGISRQALRKRIERLEYKNHIRGYTIITSYGEDTAQDPRKDSVSAFLNIRFAKGNDCFKLSQLLSSYQDTAGSWAVTGDWDMVLLVTGKSFEQISAIREAIVATGGIDEIETEAVLNVLV